MNLRVLFLLLTLLVQPAYGLAQTPEEGGGEGERQWTFTAERIVAQHDSEYVQAWGNATLRSGENYLKADFVRYYESTKWVYLKGGVQARWEGDFYQADEAEFDLSTMTGWLTNGKVFVAQPHLYFESSMVRKLKGDSYTFKDAKVTACSGEVPAWSFTAEEGHINLDGYARLWHARFNVKDVTVLYTPYMRLPVSRERKSGFLKPQWSFSDRVGFGVNLPWFQVIDDERDLTVYPNYMSDRGMMYGLEYRSATDPESKAYIRGDYLYDQKLGDDLPSKYRFEEDGLTRQNHDRYWLRSKYDGHLFSPDWKVKVDTDYVSDQDYLREFKHGYSGYLTNRDEMLEQFNRGLDVIDSTNRTSTALITRDYDNFGLAGKVAYTENLVYRNNNRPQGLDPTVQYFPNIQAFAFKQSLWGSLFEWEGTADYQYLWRERGTKAHRIDIRPRMSVPLKAGGVTVMPYLGFRQTFWAYEGFQDEPENVDEDEDFQNRFVPEAGVSLFAEAHKVWDLSDPDEEAEPGDSHWTKLLHQVQPRVEYSYAYDSEKRQEERPYFDRDDDVLRNNRLTYSLVNVFDRKRQTLTVDPDNVNSKPKIATDYLEFARLRLEQSYDFEEADRDEGLDDYPRRPFSDILAELRLRPLKYVNLYSRTWISPYEAKITEHENILELFHDDYGSVYFGYDVLNTIREYDRRNENDYQIIRAGARAFLTKEFWLTLGFSKDLNRNRELDKTVALTWNHECFRLTLSFSDTTSDQRFQVQLELLTF